jgi:hypothetical protein
MSFDQFDRVLKATSGFLQFGATVVDVPGARLNDAKNAITARYFRLFHKGCVEAVGQNVDSDTWDVVPSTGDFERVILTLAIPHSAGTASITISPAFPIDLTHTTNSCTNLLRMLHHYLSLMKAVPALATEAFRGILEILDLYGYAVWYIFMLFAPLRPFDVTQPGNRIAFRPDYVILFPPEPFQCLSRVIHRVQEAGIQLPGAPEEPLGVVQAAAASENMRAIGWYLQSVRGVLEESLHENSLGTLTRLYSDMLAQFLMNFSQFVFPLFIPALISLAEFDAELRAVKWNLSEPLTEAHSFTETWAAAVRQFAQTVTQIGVDENRRDELWVAMWTYSCFLLLNGFAGSSKCTMHGRTSMKADFKSMCHEFSQATGKRIQFDQEWVPSFVQAFFKNPTDFKAWVQAEFRRYTFAQIFGLIETGLSDDISRQAKKELRSFVQGLYKEQ